MAIYSNQTADSIVTGTSSADFINNYGSRVTINAGAGNDTINNYGSLSGNGNVSVNFYNGYSAVINGDAGNDYVLNNAPMVTIDGGAGSDTIKFTGSGYFRTITGHSYEYDYVSINGGAGNDSIHYGSIDGDDDDFSSNVIIIGGDGNDTITKDESSRLRGATIEGGKGNDLISITGSRSFYDGDFDVARINYNNGDGNDTIFGIGLNDNGSYLEITGAKYLLETVGNDLKVKVGKGSILLKDAASINPGNYIVGTLSISGEYINNLTDNTVINGSNTIINGTSKDDSIKIWASSNVTIIGGGGADTIDITPDFIINDGGYTILPIQNVSLSGGDGNDYIGTSYLSSSLDNSITIDGGAGNDTIENWSGNVIINVGIGEDSIYNGGNNVLVEGGSGNDTIVNYSRLSTLGNLGQNITIDGGNGDDFISISSDSNNNIIQYANGDGKDTIFGFNATDTLQISGSSYTTTKSGSDVKVNVGSGSILLKDAANTTLHIVTVTGGGSDTTPADTLPVGITVKNSIVTAAKTFTGNKIDLADYENATKVNAAVLTSGVSIIGDSSANSLKGGKGNDTIFGGSGKDTISLGGGADVYIYWAGNDFIQDYKSGEDKIKLANGSISGSSISGSNVILNISNGGHITVKGGKNKNITVIDSNGNETTNIYPLSTLPAGISVKSSIVTASTLFSGSEIDLSDYEKATKVNAAALSQGVSIIGTSANNSLKGGKDNDTIFGDAGKDTILGGNGNDILYGGADNDLLKGEAGNDTLSGGSGNDTLTGGAGNDVFIYEGGKDVITDYKANEDEIKLESGTITDTSYQNKDVIFKIGSGTLTVKNGKGKNISVTDSSGNTQTYSKTLDLLYDNNFMTDENNLDTITEQKFEVQNIETQTYKDLAQDSQNYLTFAKDK